MHSVLLGYCLLLAISTKRDQGEASNTKPETVTVSLNSFTCISGNGSRFAVANRRTRT